jgi:hypothetical protein
MLLNIISVSGCNLLDILYHQNESGKYEFFGFRSYKSIEDEGSTIVQSDDLDSIISNLQKVKRDIEEYNKMGS